MAQSHGDEFVPADFQPPLEYPTGGLFLIPLGPEHNQRDYDAWTSGIGHIRRTPGFENRRWPTPMTLQENHRDLDRHATDFQERTGFTYSVLAANDPNSEVIGCVYIYPGATPHTAEVRSWVRTSRAKLDRPLYEEMTRWLTEEWSFEHIEYARRPSA